MKPIIVIPTYNESANIKKLIEAIFSFDVPGLEIIVVDDSSPDGTTDIVRSLTTSHKVHLISRKGKLGLGSAYIRGFKEALLKNATHIFEMDADFSHDPADVPRLLAATKDADLAIGSRKIPGGGITGWGFVRTFMSSGAMWISRLMLGLKTKDVTAGFRCFRREVLEHIPLNKIKSNGYAFQEELLYRAEQAGFRIKEVPVIFTDRLNGYSKLSKKDIIEFFLIIFKLRFSKTPR